MKNKLILVSLSSISLATIAAVHHANAQQCYKEAGCAGTSCNPTTGEMCVNQGLFSAGSPLCPGDPGLQSGGSGCLPRFVRRAGVDCTSLSGSCATREAIGC